MTRDTIARVMAIAAIVLSLSLGMFQEPCTCDGKPKQKDRIGLFIRWIMWKASHDDFDAAPPAQDPGAQRYENAPPARKKGPTGEVELDHGRGW